jgi:hypothetical protein
MILFLYLPPVSTTPAVPVAEFAACVVDTSVKFDPGSEIWDPGWKKYGSKINIPDPQHCPDIPLLIKAFLYRVHLIIPV